MGAEIQIVILLVPGVETHADGRRSIIVDWSSRSDRVVVTVGGAIEREVVNDIGPVTGEVAEDRVGTALNGVAVQKDDVNSTAGLESKAVRPRAVKPRS